MQPCLGDTSDRVTLSAIALGGAVGALARYGIGEAWPAAPGGFPGATFAINVLGSGLIGVLMVVAIDVLPHRPLVRPFLGTGLLGGFTTFSTYSVDAQRLFAAGHASLALAYVLTTVVCGLLAVTVTARGTRALVSLVARRRVL